MPGLGDWRSVPADVAATSSPLSRWCRVRLNSVKRVSALTTSGAKAGARARLVAVNCGRLRTMLKHNEGFRIGVGS